MFFIVDVLQQLERQAKHRLPWNACLQMNRNTCLFEDMCFVSGWYAEAHERPCAGSFTLSTFGYLRRSIEMQTRTLVLVAALTLVVVSYGYAHCGRCDTNGSKDIVDTAVAAGQFKTLAAALNAADLIETLKGAGPFTVFAPTDEAFAKLPEGEVEDLLKPENKEKLIAILTYHVIPGRVLAKDVAKLDSAPTIEGSEVDIKVIGDKVMLDKATVIKADIEAGNGIIHVIDTVMLPE